MKVEKTSPRSREDLGDKVKAHTQYRLADGSRVPGVTTVLGVLAKPALVGWANRLGLEGIDSSKYRDETAAIGTLAHYLIVCDLAEDEPNLSDFTAQQVERAQWSLIKFRDWKRHHALETEFVERGLVSETYRYGGTIDWYGRLDGSPELVDFKTSAGVYAEHRIQVSGYTKLLREYEYPLKGVRVIRIGRTEDEGFSEHILGIGELKAGWEIFQACLTVHRLMPKMKGAA